MKKNLTNIDTIIQLKQQQSEENTTNVDLSGLMSVLSRHLYSTPFVAVRELVQNAHDSIIRRRIEDADFNTNMSDHSLHKIQISGNVNLGTLSITDCGAGLTLDEIHRYLATVGVGYTRTLREQNINGKIDDDGLIGMFGLGFLSAFVLAKTVTLTTTSYQSPDLAHEYQSSNGEKYTVKAVAAGIIGTTVTLELKNDFKHLCSESVLHKVLNQYCALLKVPIFIGDADIAINNIVPPWRNQEQNILPHPAILQRQRLEFAKKFEQHFEPLCAFPIQTTDNILEGLLWIQDGATYGSSDNRNLSVFVRGMLLDDDARDLLPPWAGFISGVIESNHLTPTASREDLQKDNSYYQIQAFITEALITGMAQVAKTQPEAWRRVLSRHNEALLGAALCDERLFELLAQDITIASSQGDLPIHSLKSKGNYHISIGSEGSFEDMLFRALGIPVAKGDRYGVLPFLRKWCSQNHQTLIELGSKKGNQALFTEQNLTDDIHQWLSEHLCDEEQLVAARFDPPSLPLVTVIDREAILKKKVEADETDKRISMAALSLMRSFTANIKESSSTKLFINLNNPCIKLLIATKIAQQDQSSSIKESDLNKLEQCLKMLKSIKVLMSVNQDQENQAQNSKHNALNLNQAFEYISEFIINSLE
ncbi:histidine kinase [Gammaproteobacteria bacterium]|nr:histidine kinase [Gammaproteobacteria bacterium]